MLRGVPVVVTPDLLHVLASMGHGDGLAIVDANFPAAARATRLVVLPGVSATRLLSAVLRLMPLDDFVPAPAAVMQVVGKPEEVPEIVREFTTILAKHGGAAPVALERNDFYRAAGEAFAIVRTGERRLYGNILLLKGVVRPSEKTT